LNYIQVPISAVLFLGDKGNRIRPKLYAGIYAASLQNSNDGGVTVVGQTAFNKLDVGGQVGVGLNYRLRSRTWLNIDLGYTAGLTTLSDSPTGKIRNKGYNLNVGLAIPLFGS
jgi:hypothetical protein